MCRGTTTLFSPNTVQVDLEMHGNIDVQMLKHDSIKSVWSGPPNDEDEVWSECWNGPWPGNKPNPGPEVWVELER